jgi:hypothetical protein
MPTVARPRIIRTRLRVNASATAGAAWKTRILVRADPSTPTRPKRAVPKAGRIAVRTTSAMKCRSASATTWTSVATDLTTRSCRLAESSKQCVVAARFRLVQGGLRWKLERRSGRDRWRHRWRWWEWCGRNRWHGWWIDRRHGWWKCKLRRSVRGCDVQPDRHGRSGTKCLSARRVLRRTRRLLGQHGVRFFPLLHQHLQSGRRRLAILWGRLPAMRHEPGRRQRAERLPAGVPRIRWRYWLTPARRTQITHSRTCSSTGTAEAVARRLAGFRVATLGSQRTVRDGNPVGGGSTLWGWSLAIGNLSLEVQARSLRADAGQTWPLAAVRVRVRTARVRKVEAVHPSPALACTRPSASRHELSAPPALALAPSCLWPPWSRTAKSVIELRRGALHFRAVRNIGLASAIRVAFRGAVWVLRSDIPASAAPRGRTSRCKRKADPYNDREV